MSPSYDVFLSHSTADKPAVEELARKLRVAGVEPFLDKWHLVPGRLWQPELEAGLRDSRSCAIFIGAEGFGPWETQEALVALDRGARDPEFAVIPVLLPGFSRPHRIPAFLAQRTWVEFRDLVDEDAFHRLVSGIRGIPPDAGSGGGVAIRSYRSMAQPPETFIHRQEYDEVLAALCPGTEAVQSMSVGITTALRGAGGFGKTALAQAICQDPQVRQTYPAGILWTTMGEDIDANGRLARVRDLIRWWTQEEAPAFETVTAAGARLRELLTGSRVLVIIDDVWSSADVTPFQGLGKDSAVLITTRDSQTLPADTARVNVDAMEPSEAVSLLGLGLPDGFFKELQSLAARLGEWALLLKLVNRQLQELVKEDGLPVPKALREAEEVLEAEGFAAFNRDDKDSRHAAASQAILVSVRRLPENERALYFQLAVFPEDAHIPLSVLERFWCISHFQTRKLCRRLHDLSLLSELDGEKGTIRLHDVVRRVLIEQIGKDLPSLHGRLLDAFRPASGAWSDSPAEESYLWRNLAYHFLGAERREELRKLLFDFSFLKAKLGSTDINALIGDYEAFVEEDRELRLIRDSLRLSAHVLARDRQQLASQLHGRLLDFQRRELQPLLDAALPELWLRPRQANLTPPGGPLIRTLEGHWDEINVVAVVDSRRVVSGSQDGTVRVWDLETGETLRTLKVHEYWFVVVAVVDSRRAVSSSDYGALRLWDLETGETLRTLRGHSDEISAVAVVDGHRAVSGSQDRTLRVWNLETGETLLRLEGHSKNISALAVVDGRRVISGSSDRTLRVWDLETGETLRTLKGHSGEVSAVAVVDSRRAISASLDRTLRVWDLKTGKTLRILKGHSAGVTTLVVVNGRQAISGSIDRTLRVWDLETGEILHTLEWHPDGITALAMVDDRRVISGSSDGMLRVWSLEAGEIRHTPERSNGVLAVAIVDGRRAVSGSRDGQLRIWDLETGKILRTFGGLQAEVLAVAAVDGHRVISGSNDGKLRVWDLETGDNLRTISQSLPHARAMAVVDTRRVISVSFFDTRLTVWNLVTGQALSAHKEFAYEVYAVAVVDGHRAVSGFGSRLLLWDFETGETLRTFEWHLTWIRAVAVVNRRQVISGSDDCMLRVWDLETGETLQILEGHSGKVSTVASSGQPLGSLWLGGQNVTGMGSRNRADGGGDYSGGTCRRCSHSPEWSDRGGW